MRRLRSLPRLWWYAGALIRTMQPVSLRTFVEARGTRGKGKRVQESCISMGTYFTGKVSVIESCWLAWYGQLL